MTMSRMFFTTALVPWLFFSGTQVVSVSVANISTCTFELSTAGSLATLRDSTGTINGPLPVQPNSPKPQFDYDVEGYTKSFKTLGMGWVRFQDLGMDEGGTSMSQLFLAWPHTDAELAAADVKKLTSNQNNFNFSSLDRQVKAALSAGANLDFRLGDSHQIAALLEQGMAIPVNGQDVQFPKSWGFPTNIQTEKGIALWTAVALEVAKRVWKLAGADPSRVQFDLLTELTDDTVFWPGNASHYATLYSNVMPQIKSQLGSSVTCIGANTLSPKKPGPDGADPWIDQFLAACGRMGYQKCPLDMVAFHVFTPKAAQSITDSATYVQERMQKHLTSFKSMPKMVMTAWGFHGSGMYEFNAKPDGAAVMANGLIAIENAPIEWAILYKWAGINCANLESPCLVVNVPGTLKANAIPFEFHHRMRQTSTKRIRGTCNGTDNLNVIAVGTADSTAMAAMITPLVANADDIPPAPAAPMRVTAKHLKCASSVKLSIDYVDAKVAADGSAIVKTTTVKGKVDSSGNFVEDGTSKPYEVQPEELAFASLITVACA